MFRWGEWRFDAGWNSWKAKCIFSHMRTYMIAHKFTLYIAFFSLERMRLMHIIGFATSVTIQLFRPPFWLYLILISLVSRTCSRQWRVCVCVRVPNGKWPPSMRPWCSFCVNPRSKPCVFQSAASIFAINNRKFPVFVHRIQFHNSQLSNQMHFISERINRPEDNL